MKSYSEDEFADLCKKAWETFGKYHQMRQLQEECAELIVAINHHFRDRDKYLEETTEEMADVLIILTQMIWGLDMYEQINQQMNNKLQRLESKLNHIWQPTK